MFIAVSLIGMRTLNLMDDPVDLTAELIDIASPSHEEAAIADVIEASLRCLNVEVKRVSHTVVARTHRGFPTRVILAGHHDTVPIANNVPHRRTDTDLHGCGSVDMKSGLAVYLNAFATLADSDDLQHDLTLVSYEAEEVREEYNGLGIVEKQAPEWLAGDVALLGEPTAASVELGCQGSIRLNATAHGQRAHSARAWKGSNAAHALAPVIARIAGYSPRRVLIDGCEYREGLNIVTLRAGVATNTIPDEAFMQVNYRFAPDKTLEEAKAHLFDVLGEHSDVTYEIDDAVGAAPPGLHLPAIRELIEITGGDYHAKFGWTDVARFSKLGIPALNFGPGDSGLAHKPEEHCPIEQIYAVSAALQKYLTSSQRES